MLLLSLLLSFQIAAQPPVNLSGSWLRTDRSCRPAGKKNGPYRMIVEHAGTGLKITILATVKGAERKLVLNYKTTGEEIHYRGLDGDDFRGRARWNGRHLVFNIAELEKGEQIHSEEIWTLADDEKHISITKTEEGEHEHSSCTSAFAKPRFRR